jgi:hypothetical protein
MHNFAWALFWLKSVRAFRAVNERPLERLVLFAVVLVGLGLMVAGFLGGLSQSAIAMGFVGSLMVGLVGLWLIAGAVPLSLVFWKEARQRAASWLALFGAFLFVVGTEAGFTFSALAVVGLVGVAAGIVLLIAWCPVAPAGYEWRRGEDGLELVKSPEGAEVRALFGEATEGRGPRQGKGKDRG